MKDLLWVTCIAVLIFVTAQVTGEQEKENDSQSKDNTGKVRMFNKDIETL